MWQDPAWDPWTSPHSCGEHCGRQLVGCQHRCKLLCHPGTTQYSPSTVHRAVPPVCRSLSALPPDRQHELLLRGGGAGGAALHGGGLGLWRGVRGGAGLQALLPRPLPPPTLPALSKGLGPVLRLWPPEGAPRLLGPRLQVRHPLRQTAGLPAPPVRHHMPRRCGQ